MHDVTTQTATAEQPSPLPHVRLTQCRMFSVVNIWVSDDTVSTTGLCITPFPSSCTEQDSRSNRHYPWQADRTVRLAIWQPLIFTATARLIRNTVRLIRNTQTRASCPYRCAAKLKFIMPLEQRLLNF